MAGLANDAAHFFKFLFILVLYTLAMTLFVSDILTIFCLCRPVRPELPACHPLPQRWYCHSLICAVCSLPNDIRGFFRPPQFHTSRITLAAVALSSEIYPGSAVCKRGWIWSNDTRHASRSPSRRVCQFNHESGESYFNWVHLY